MRQLLNLNLEMTSLETSGNIHAEKSEQLTEKRMIVTEEINNQRGQHRTHLIPKALRQDGAERKALEEIGNEARREQRTALQTTRERAQPMMQRYQPWQVSMGMNAENAKRNLDQGISCSST